MLISAIQMYFHSSLHTQMITGRRSVSLCGKVLVKEVGQWGISGLRCSPSSFSCLAGSHYFAIQEKVTQNPSFIYVIIGFTNTCQ